MTVNDYSTTLLVKRISSIRLIFCAVLLLLPSSLHAQVDRSGLGGTAIDPAGGVPQAHVTAQQVCATEKCQRREAEFI